MAKNWCDHFEPLLLKAKDHDTREKVLIAMTTLKDKCKSEFQKNKNLIQTLNKLQSEFRTLVAEENGDEYFIKLKSCVDLILSQIISDRIEL